MKCYSKILFIVGIVTLTACSTYQRHFGGKSGDYANANTIDAIEYPAGVASLPASDRYNIPEAKTTEQTVVITPPDYQD